MGAQEILASINGVTITRSDRDILQGPNYINDSIINFYFTYLSLTYDTQDILLVSPSISFFIANCYDSDILQECIEPLQLLERKLIFFAINDNDSADRGGGGNHWSLLVYYKPLNTFIHHDSLKGFNTSSAVQLYDAVKGFVNTTSSGGSVRPTELSDELGNTKKKKRRNFLEAEFSNWYTPQQRNYYDCGLYVLAIADLICKWYANSETRAVKEGSFWLDDLEDRVISSNVESTMRGNLLRLIDFFQ